MCLSVGSMKQAIQIDEKNRRILTILQENARVSNAEIARQLGMTTSAVFERIRKMEERGIIRGYSVQVEPAALGLPLSAFVSVKINPHRLAPEVGRAIAEVEGVEEAYHLTGEECFLARIRCSDTDSLERILMQINDIEPVYATRTVIILRSAKEISGALLSSVVGALGTGEGA